MKTKRIVTLIAFGFFMITGFLLYFIIYTKQPPIQGQVINGRDEHGCFIGYQWNYTGMTCEETTVVGEKIYQVFDFNSCQSSGYAIDENNKTGFLQCHALNGTVYTQNSTNATKGNETIKVDYPSNVLLYGNFTIVQNSNETNATNESAPNPYSNLTINSTNITNQS
jgi:hypothetical protein